VSVFPGRIGVWTSSSQWPDDPARNGSTASELEALGYQAIWLGGAAADLELAETLLRATERLVVATGIVNIWTEPAGKVADSFHRINARYPQRLLLGVGAGHASMVGARYRQPYQQLVAYLDELDAATPPVPVADRVLAALGPRVLALAAARSSGAHPYLVTPEHTAQARQALGAGKLLAPELMVVLDTDPQRARATARGRLAMYLELPNYLANLRRLGFTEDDLAAPGSDRLVDALVAWGDAETIARRVGEHYQAGADHVCIQPLDPDGALPHAQWRDLAPALTA
jgi:probable F420-dependent oxidoreductase